MVTHCEDWRHDEPVAAVAVIREWDDNGSRDYCYCEEHMYESLEEVGLYECGRTLIGTIPTD